ncbi:MAG: transposase [Verrucomicrobiota bacterium]|nr:transposase [Verrucomicrobiota bacterium]
MPPYPKLPPRLDLIYFRHPVFFVTICTHRRRRLLANAPLHETFVAFAERAYAAHNIAVGRYVIMPDHLHLFVCGDQKFALGRWIGMLKQFLAKTLDRAGASNACEPVWQRGFFDHLLRSDESYAQKWQYVWDNPVRAGLVDEAEDWQYAGEIILIDRA